MQLSTRYDAGIADIQGESRIVRSVADLSRIAIFLHRLDYFIRIGRYDREGQQVSACFVILPLLPETSELIGLAVLHCNGEWLSRLFIQLLPLIERISGNKTAAVLDCLSECWRGRDRLRFGIDSAETNAGSFAQYGYCRRIQGGTTEVPKADFFGTAFAEKSASSNPKWTPTSNGAFSGNG